jgi:hypothetical protein
MVVKNLLSENDLNDTSFALSSEFGSSLNTDIFRKQPRYQRLSVSSDGKEANATSDNPLISASGRFVLFDSDANNLVPEDTNNLRDIFIRDRLKGTISRIIGINGKELDGSSKLLSISNNARKVLLWSGSTNLIKDDPFREPGFYVYDVVTGLSTRVNVGNDGIPAESGTSTAVMSADGRTVAFTTFDRLTPEDISGDLDIYVRDLSTNTTSWITVDYKSGIPVNSPRGSSSGLSISADGRYVGFISDSRRILEETANMAALKIIYQRDRQTNTTKLISRDFNGNPSGLLFSGGSYSMSLDGRYITYSTGLQITADDNNEIGETSDVFIYDSLTDKTKLVSRDENGKQFKAGVRNFSISPDGQYILFAPGFNLLEPIFPTGKKYLYETKTGTNKPIVVDTNGDGKVDIPVNLQFSNNGRFITFTSDDSKLVANDNNGFTDVFVTRNFLF